VEAALELNPSMLDQVGVRGKGRMIFKINMVFVKPLSAKTDLASDPPALRSDVSRPSSPLEYSQPELIRCFLRRLSAAVWGSRTFFFTSHISRITYHVSRLTGLANS